MTEQRQDSDRHELNALVSSLNSGIQALAVSEQTSTIHVATGLAIFGVIYSVFYQALSAEIPRHDQLWWLGLPTLTLFHFGWTAFRTAQHAVNEHYLLDLEEVVASELRIEMKSPADGLHYRFPSGIALSREVRRWHGPISGSLVSALGVVFYAIGQTSVIALSFYLSRDGDASVRVFASLVYFGMVLSIGIPFLYCSFRARQFYEKVVKSYVSRESHAAGSDSRREDAGFRLIHLQRAPEAHGQPARETVGAPIEAARLDPGPSPIHWSDPPLVGDDGEQ